MAQRLFDPCAPAQQEVKMGEAVLEVMFRVEIGTENRGTPPGTACP